MTISNDKDRDELHERCERLTGNAWCPYPSYEFILATKLVDDARAVELINKRREFCFPSFFVGEPMEKEIYEIFREYGIVVTY